MYLPHVNQLPEVDDIRLVGMPVTQSLGPPPVSTAPHTINANIYWKHSTKVDFAESAV